MVMNDDGMTHMMLCDVHLESLYQLRYKVVGLCRRELRLQAVR